MYFSWLSIELGQPLQNTDATCVSAVLGYLKGRYIDICRSTFHFNPDTQMLTC